MEKALDRIIKENIKKPKSKHGYCLEYKQLKYVYKQKSSKTYFPMKYYMIQSNKTIKWQRAITLDTGK